MAQNFLTAGNIVRYTASSLTVVWYSLSGCYGALSSCNWIDLIGFQLPIAMLWSQLRPNIPQN